MPDTPNQHDLASQVLAFLDDLLVTQGQMEEIPPQLSAIEGFDQHCELLNAIKFILYNYSMGQFTCKVQIQGSTADYLKTLQSNFRHLVWHCKSVTAGDLSQQAEFMGELSEAFNAMTRSLIKQNEDIQQKQEELNRLSDKFYSDVKKKETTEEAVKASEEKFSEKSLRDSLTGLYSRSCFFKAASQIVDSLQLQHNRFCLVMVGIDRFKEFNETYGPEVGDKAIQMVAHVLSDTLRTYDICCRYGGETFTLFLAGASLEQGRKITERILQIISSKPHPAGDTTESVTVSAGLSFVETTTFGPPVQEGEILMKALTAADSAFNEARHNGISQVKISSDPGL